MLPAGSEPIAKRAWVSLRPLIGAPSGATTTEAGRVARTPSSASPLYCVVVRELPGLDRRAVDTLSAAWDRRGSGQELWSDIRWLVVRFGRRPGRARTDACVAPPRHGHLDLWQRRSLWPAEGAGRQRRAVLEHADEQEMEGNERSGLATTG